MATQLKRTAVVRKRRIELEVPECEEGATVKVTIEMPDAPPSPRRTFAEFLESLPFGPHSAPTSEELDRRLQAERDAWDDESHDADPLAQPVVCATKPVADMTRR